MTTTPALPTPRSPWLAARGRTSLALAATGVLGTASLLMGLAIALVGPFVVGSGPDLPPFLTDLTIFLELVASLGILAAIFLGVPLCGLLRFHEFLLAPADPLPAGPGPAPAATRLVAALAAPARPLVSLALLLLLPAILAILLTGEDSPARLVAVSILFVNLTLLPARGATNRAAADLRMIESAEGAKKAPPPSAPGEPEPPRFA